MKFFFFKEDLSSIAQNIENYATAMKKSGLNLSKDLQLFILLIDVALK
jgi:hypothetical protein